MNLTSGGLVGGVMKISFIVPCYNEVENIEECINSLLQQIVPIDEILIVDDGSNDATRNILKKIESQKVKVILNERNRGRPFSLNRGLEIANGTVICIIDADCRPEETWLKRGISKLKKSDVASGPYTVPPNGNAIQIGHQIVNDFFRSRIQSNYVTGGNLIIKKEILHQIGGFDENSPYGEDYNLSRELAKRGTKIYYGSDMGVVSTGEPKSIKEIIQQRLTQGSTLRYSLKKYGLSIGTIARFFYVLTFLLGFVFHALWIITAIPMASLLFYGLINIRRYTVSGILLAPFIGLIRTTAIFFGFLIGKTKKWRQLNENNFSG